MNKELLKSFTITILKTASLAKMFARLAVFNSVILPILLTKALRHQMLAHQMRHLLVLEALCHLAFLCFLS